jgi:hypothetical protein
MEAPVGQAERAGQQLVTAVAGAARTAAAVYLVL